jgi:hypothetical protein
VDSDLYFAYRLVRSRRYDPRICASRKGILIQLKRKMTPLVAGDEQDIVTGGDQLEPNSFQVVPSNAPGTTR